MNQENKYVGACGCGKDDTGTVWHFESCDNSKSKNKEWYCASCAQKRAGDKCVSCGIGKFTTEVIEKKQGNRLLMCWRCWPFETECCVCHPGNKRCIHCDRIRDFHCGHQHWCYDNYHSKNPTKWEPK